MNINDELFSDSIYADEESIWIISTGRNLLQGIDRSTGKVVDGVFIPTNKKALIPYRSFFKYGNCLYILPYSENTIKKYDIKNKTFSNITMNSDFVGEDGNCGVFGYSLLGTKAVMYSSRESVCVFDMSTYKMNVLDLSSIRKKSGYKDPFSWIWNHSFVKGDEVWLIPQNYLCAVVIDLKEEIVNLINFETDIPIDGTMDTPFLAKDNLYFSYRNSGNQKSELLKLNIETGHMTRIIEFEAFNYTSRASGYIGAYGNVLIFLPGMTDKAYVVDLDSGKYELLPGIPAVSAERLAREKFPRELNYRTAFLTENGHLLALHGWTGCLIDLDIKTKEFVEHDVVVEPSVDRVKMYLETGDNCIQEVKACGLDVFLNYIAYEQG